MASLCQRVAYNLRQQACAVKLFEIARTYYLESGRVREKYSLGFVLCGTDSLWFSPKIGHVGDQPGFLHLKGISETLLERLGIAGAGYRFLNGLEAELLLNNQRAGIMRKLSRQALETLDIKHKDVFAAELDLEEKILPLAADQRKFNPAGVPRFPAITRDITLPVKNEVSFEQICQAVYELNETLLFSAAFKDCYEGEKAAQGTKKVTLSLRYGSPQRTLTEEEIIPVHDRLVLTLESRFQTKIS